MRQVHNDWEQTYLWRQKEPKQTGLQARKHVHTSPNKQGLFHSEFKLALGLGSDDHPPQSVHP